VLGIQQSAQLGRHQGVIFLRHLQSRPGKKTRCWQAIPCTAPTTASKSTVDSTHPYNKVHSTACTPAIRGQVGPVETSNTSAHRGCIKGGTFLGDARLLVSKLFRVMPPSAANTKACRLYAGSQQTLDSNRQPNSPSAHHHLVHKHSCYISLVVLVKLHLHLR
jgi:hypothetical protein